MYLFRFVFFPHVWIVMHKVPFTQGCDLRATFERPENWPGRSVVAQTQKVLFLCNCARPLCVPWTTKTTVMTQQAVQRRQSGGRTIIMVAQGLPWSSNGGTVVATVIVQWSLLVDQKRHSGGTRETEASHKLVHNVYNCTNYFTGRPMADPCASILRPRRCACFPPASYERPVSDRPPRRPFCDCFEHALHGDHGVHAEVWTSSVPPLNDQGNLSPSSAPSTATWPDLWSHKGGTKVAAPVWRGYECICALAIH